MLRRRGEETGSLTILPYAAVTAGCRGEALAELGLLREAGAVAFTDGATTLRSARLMRLALSYARGFGARIVQHPEEPSLAAGGAATEGELATRLGLPGIPAAAEAIQVARDISLAQLTGGAVHFAHVSTADALALIRRAKEDGAAVTCDTAPPYFDLNETAIGDFRTYAKLSPPLRKDADRQAVAAALADGTIDAVASDHQPRDADDKRLPFAQATPGGVGLATLLGVTLAQVHNGTIGLPLAIELLTARPARLLGSRGRPAGQGRPRRSVPVPSRSGSGRSNPASCPARRRTRRSTDARWRAWCWAPGRRAAGCSGSGTNAAAGHGNRPVSARKSRTVMIRQQNRPKPCLEGRAGRRHGRCAGMTVERQRLSPGLHGVLPRH